MRENCTYGSVRGVLGNRHPYRDLAGLQPAFVVFHRCAD